MPKWITDKQALQAIKEGTKLRANHEWYTDLALAVKDRVRYYMNVAQECLDKCKGCKDDEAHNWRLAAYGFASQAALVAYGAGYAGWQSLVNDYTPDENTKTYAQIALIKYYYMYDCDGNLRQY